MKKWPKNPHTGSHGLYWEREPASFEQREEAEAWIASQMIRWLSERDRLPSDRSLGEVIEQRDRNERMLNDAVADLVATKNRLELLEAEYARLRRVAEARPSTSQRQRWTLTDDMWGSDVSHYQAARSADTYRQQYERNSEMANEQAKRNVAWSRSQYVNSLREYARKTAGSTCLKACCRQRDAMVAELDSLSDDE